MAQQPADFGQWNAALQQPGRVGVPQVVDPHVPHGGNQAKRRRPHPERSVGVAQHRAHLAGQHQSSRAPTSGVLDSAPLPCLRPQSGNPITRYDVAHMSQRICKLAGLKPVRGHALRRSAITCALDAGVRLRDAQILARHADPRTTERYDIARQSLDRHGVHILTAYVAGC